MVFFLCSHYETHEKISFLLLFMCLNFLLRGANTKCGPHHFYAPSCLDFLSYSLYVWLKWMARKRSGIQSIVNSHKRADGIGYEEIWWDRIRPGLSHTTLHSLALTLFAIFFSDPFFIPSLSINFYQTISFISFNRFKRQKLLHKMIH